MASSENNDSNSSQNELFPSSADSSSIDIVNDSSNTSGLDSESDRTLDDIDTLHSEEPQHTSTQNPQGHCHQATLEYLAADSTFEDETDGSVIDPNASALGDGSVDIVNDTHDQTDNDTKTCCTLCDKPDSPSMIMCHTCKLWQHYECTALPRYQIYALTSSTRKYECMNCVDVPDSFASVVQQKPTQRAPTQQVPPPSQTTASLQIDLCRSFKDLESNLLTALSLRRTEEQNAEIQQLRIELADERKALKSLQGDVLRVHKNCHAAETRHNSDRILLHASCSGTCETAMNLTHQREQLHTKVGTLESELLHHKQSLDSVTSNRDTLRSQVSELNAQIETVRRDLNKADSAYAAEMTKTHELQNQLSQLQSQLSASQQRCNTLTDQVLNLKEQLGNTSSTAWSTVARSKPERSGEGRPSTDNAQNTPSAQNTLDGARSSDGNRRKHPSNTHRDSPENDARDTHQDTSGNNAHNKLPPRSTHDSPGEPHVLIVGNSNVSRIMPSRMYNNRSVHVEVLRNGEKNIDGAINYIAHCHLKPRVVIFQVASNSIVNENVDSCLSKTKHLLQRATARFPTATIYIGEGLPRQLENPNHTDTYIHKLNRYNNELYNICDNAGAKVIAAGKLSTFGQELFTSDGVHLNRRGLGVLVKNYKTAMGHEIGVPYDTSQRSPNAITPHPPKPQRHESDGSTSSPPTAQSKPAQIANNWENNNIKQLMDTMNRQQAAFQNFLSSMSNLASSFSPQLTVS